MTNEELANRIKNGNTDCMGVLWEQVKGYVITLINRYYELYKEACSSAGVNIDDMEQEGFLAVMDAAEAYTEDKGCGFLSYIKYPLKNRLNELLGYRTSKTRPLNCCKSLDEPIGSYTDELTIADTIADDEAEAAINDVIEDGYIKQLHDDLDKCLARLPEQQAEVIRLRYYKELPFESIGRALNMQTQCARYEHNKAMSKLRQGYCVKLLRPYLELDIIDTKGYKSSFGRWKNTGCSSTETAAFKLMNI